MNERGPTSGGIHVVAFGRPTRPRVPPVLTREQQRAIRRAENWRETALAELARLGAGDDIIEAVESVARRLQCQLVESAGNPE